MTKNIFKSLKTALLIVVACLVVFTGVVVSQLVIRNYSISLLSSAIISAESIARKLALDVTDKILINDLVAVQKILDDQLQSEHSVSYLFILSNQKVLVHTFPEGVPVKLISINNLENTVDGNVVKLIAETGERFIDIRWPIFKGKAGVLRLGISEEPYLHKVQQLNLKMTLITAAVLVVSLFLSHLLISYLLTPLLKLTDAVENIDEENLDSRLSVKGLMEIDKLVGAYNAMLGRLSDYTTRLKKSNLILEQKNLDLDRAHNQLMTTFSVSQKISCLPDLKTICSFLIKTLQDIVECKKMSILVFDNEQKIPYLVIENNFILLKKELFNPLYKRADSIDSPIFLKDDEIKALPLLNGLTESNRMAIFPFHHHKRILGAVLISCLDDCVCVKTEMDVIHLILKQASGAVFRASEHEKEIKSLKNRMDTVSDFKGMIGKDPKIQIIYKLIEDVAPTDATVLIQGESGTGKEMVAKALHDISDRSNNPFIVINCSAYPATLLESELFGHEKGAFTGAVSRKIGRFEQAIGGTVFLDEIGEISLSAQTMLLRVLQSQKIERIGGEKSIKVNTRVLAATNKNLLEEVKTGNFREDLYYRLNVIPIDLPALSERKNDVPLLANFFLKKFAKEQGKSISIIESETMRLLLDYNWPGNIRELENTIEHAVTLSKFDSIFISDLPNHILENLNARKTKKIKVLTANEENLIRQALDECNWNKTNAATHLGISRSTLYEKLKKYRILSPNS
ncbi:MAG: sigma 54-interacting transcriptional regulator [Desulfobacula sp.]|nr:sigma 54-interacting transcriptional regulator [Desulfobacula sp.]